MDWLVFFRDGIAAWLPLFFAVLLILMVYILAFLFRLFLRPRRREAPTPESSTTQSRWLVLRGSRR